MSVPIHELDPMAQLAVDILNRDTAFDPVDAPPIRRALATCDPDVIALYERLVIAREGARRFVRACIEDGADWLPDALRVDDLLARAQRAIEGLR